MSQRGLFGDKMEPEKQTKKKHKATLANVVSLITGTTPAQDAKVLRQAEKVEELKQGLEELYDQLRVTREYNPRLTASDLEYYGDQRLHGDWWWLLFDIDEMEPWTDAPQVKDYDIGAAWRKYMNHEDTSPNEDTIRYVQDRAKWAEKFILSEIKDAVICYKNAKAKTTQPSSLLGT